MILALPRQQLIGIKKFTYDLKNNNRYFCAPEDPDQFRTINYLFLPLLTSCIRYHKHVVLLILLDRASSPLYFVFLDLFSILFYFPFNALVQIPFSTCHFLNIICFSGSQKTTGHRITIDVCVFMDTLTLKWGI